MTSDVNPQASWIIISHCVTYLCLICVCPLQPQNILLTSARPLGDIRIVDFGLSRRMDNITEVREILGTPEYVGESCIQPLNTQKYLRLFKFSAIYHD